MMYSDYYTITLCAFSIIFAPFMIISQLRFSHIAQAGLYSIKNYFCYIKNNFLKIYIPPIGISVLAVLGIGFLKAYLYNTHLYDIQAFMGFAVEIGYMCLLAGICVILAVIFGVYTKYIKIESERTIKCDNAFISLFLCSSIIVTALITIANIFPGTDASVFFMPLITPLIMPLSAAVTSYKRAAAQ